MGGMMGTYKHVIEVRTMRTKTVYTVYFPLLCGVNRLTNKTMLLSSLRIVLVLGP
jgi:hypothetical protein